MLRSIGDLCAIVSSPPAAQQHRSAPDARAQGLQRDAKVCRGTQHERSRDKGLGATAQGQGGAGAAGKLRCLRSS